MKIIRPEVDFDISVSGLNYAWNRAKSEDFGRPVELLFSPAYEPDVIEKLIGPRVFNAIPFTCASWLSDGSWMILFERGIFVSHGP